VYGSRYRSCDQPGDEPAHRHDEWMGRAAEQRPANRADENEKGREPAMLLAAFSYCGLP